MINPTLREGTLARPREFRYHGCTDEFSQANIEMEASFCLGCIHRTWILKRYGMMSSGAISIKTEIPGLKSREITARKVQCVPGALDSLARFFIAEGDGALVRDVDGNQIIDLTGGWSA